MMMFKKTIEEEEIDKLPLFTYEGEISVIDQKAKIGKAIRDLKRWLRIGFDTETKPAFQKGVVHDVGLLQLSSPEHAYLFRLNKTGLTPDLANLLADENIMKIGVGIRDDLRGLRHLREFTPKQFLDLQVFVKAFGIEEMSFSKLMAIIFNVRISKRQRTSNWEAPMLTDAQIHYAATDAWGALKMHEALLSDAPPRLSAN